ncbi:hypothetical protein PHET_01399 [Paragonimus heterotremus]|uniref:Choline transporter-like protein n=1 Tax=Paragonimus heterotremus TaxID=100268 RepID=A0A8J4WKI7_9TREM|nr:hypothetical protein PHET_01399 [Paragonimus heterotremus]
MCIPKRFKTHMFDSKRTSGQPKEISLHDHLDLRLPWIQMLVTTLVCFVLSVGFLLFLLWCPPSTIPLTFALFGLALLASLVLLSMRLVIQSELIDRLGWWPERFFHSMEQSSQILYCLLLSINSVTLLIAVIISVAFWRPNSQWRIRTFEPAQRLLRILSKTLRELPVLVIFVPLVNTIVLCILLSLFLLVCLLLVTTVETVRQKNTGCISFKQYIWVQYVAIPLFLLYSAWMLRFFQCLCQTVTVVIVSSWYHVSTSKTHFAVSRTFGEICQRFRTHAMGSISFISLAATVTWLPYQFLASLKLCLSSCFSDVDEDEETRRRNCWCSLEKLENKLHHLDCTVCTLMVTEQQPFTKCWSMITNGLGEQLGSVGLVEMMRLPCLLFTWIKFSCALMSTCLCLVYFSTKPPAIHAFPALFIVTLFVNLLVATSILSIPQHILSTILVCFCLEEEVVYASAVMKEDVLIGFRHDEVKMELFPTYLKPSPTNENLDEYAHELPAVSIPHRKQASNTAFHNVQHRASQTGDPFI